MKNKFIIIIKILVCPPERLPDTANESFLAVVCGAAE